MGEHDISKERDCESDGKNCLDPVQDIDIEKAIKHAAYDSVKKTNDIALVRMKLAADLTKNNVRTICLPTTPETQISRVDKKVQEKMLISGSS